MPRHPPRQEKMKEIPPMPSIGIDVGSGREGGGVRKRPARRDACVPYGVQQRGRGRAPGPAVARARLRPAQASLRRDGLRTRRGPLCGSRGHRDHLPRQGRRFPVRRRGTVVDVGGQDTKVIVLRVAARWSVCDERQVLGQHGEVHSRSWRNRLGVSREGARAPRAGGRAHVHLVHVHGVRGIGGHQPHRQGNAARGHRVRRDPNRWWSGCRCSSRRAKARPTS